MIQMTKIKIKILQILIIIIKMIHLYNNTKIFQKTNKIKLHKLCK